MSPKSKTLLAATVIIVFLEGCSNGRSITRRSELSDPLRTGEITVLTNENARYDLANYKVVDSAIVGVGFRRINGSKNPFSGTVPFSSITYISTKEAAPFKTILAFGAIGFVGITAMSYLEKSDDLSVTGTTHHFDPRYAGSTGGSDHSCPYIYSWNGKADILEGEAYGVAWGKALEMNTCTLLPSLRSDQGILKVAMTNERPETHYYNSVSLCSVEADSGAEVVADRLNALWPVNEREIPRFARDQNGLDVTNDLAATDRIYWEDSSENLAGRVGYEDRVEMEFDRPEGRTDGSIIIRAINTKIIGAVFQGLFGLLGDDALEFAQAVEHDPELISILRDWQAEASLKVLVWNGSEWEPAGSVLPEATEVPFSRVVRIHTNRSGPGPVRVRLQSLADVWKIDAVNADWTPVRPLMAREVPLVSAVGPGGVDVSSALSCVDDSYRVLFPGDRIDLRYKAVIPSRAKRVHYALNVEGYLHEWIQPSRHPDPFSSLTPTARISLIKTILKSRDLFLGDVYAEWAASRGSGWTMGEGKSGHTGP